MLEDKAALYASEMPRGPDRELILECAQEIADLRRECERLRIVIDSYARSSAAAAQEINLLRGVEP